MWNKIWPYLVFPGFFLIALSTLFCPIIFVIAMITGIIGFVVLLTIEVGSAIIHTRTTKY